MVNQVATLLALYEPDNNFSVIMSIGWGINIVILTVQQFGVILTGMIIWYSCCLYLKLKFSEVNYRIVQSIRTRNIKLLEYAIEEHTYCTILTRDFNNNFKNILFVIYYMVTPGLQMALFSSHHSQVILQLADDCLRRVSRKQIDVVLYYWGSRCALQSQTEWQAFIF